MKGLILAGGTGSRLRPITHTGPKQLIPIANRPVLEYAINDLKDAGIDEIGVILGQVGREEIQEHLGDGSDFDVDITYIVQGRPLGIAHAVGCARDFVGTDSFVVYLGDNIMQQGISELVNDFDSSEYDAGIGLQEVDNPSRFGVADVDENGEVKRLVEKPDDPPSNLALIGIYIFTPEIFNSIEMLEQSWRGEYEITDAIQDILDGGGRIQSHVVEGWWKDTGKPKDILHANRLVLDDISRKIEGKMEEGAEVQGRIEIGEGSVIKENAVVRGPVSIGEGTVVGNGTYIGPYTSIGDNCRIRNTHIESSVVIGSSSINCDTKIVDSLLGSNVDIKNSENEVPSGSRLIVGENSNLRL